MSCRYERVHAWALAVGNLNHRPLELITLADRDLNLDVNRLRERREPLFKIDIETCAHCGGAVKVLASIEDPVVIKTILDHLAQAEAATPVSRPFARAPPQQKLPGLTQPG